MNKKNLLITSGIITLSLLNARNIQAKDYNDFRTGDTQTIETELFETPNQELKKIKQNTPEEKTTHGEIPQEDNIEKTSNKTDNEINELVRQLNNLLTQPQADILNKLVSKETKISELLIEAIILHELTDYEEASKIYTFIISDYIGELSEAEKLFIVSFRELSDENIRILEADFLEDDEREGAKNSSTTLNNSKVTSEGFNDGLQEVTVTKNQKLEANKEFSNKDLKEIQNDEEEIIEKSKSLSGAISIKSQNADYLYNQSVNAYGASTAWKYAQELKEKYPNDERVSEVIFLAADRLLTLGNDHHKNENFASASVYYSIIIEESLLSGSLLEKTNILLYLSLNNQTIKTADEMYSDAMTAYGASDAWKSARLFKVSYPNDSRVQEAITNAAQRLFTLGINNYNNKNYDSAIVYFDMILSENLINNDTRQKINAYYYLAENKITVKNEQELYEKSVHAYGATEAWDLSLMLKSLYPDSKYVISAIDTAAKRLLTLGENNHQNNNYSSAVVYYDMIMNEELVEYETYRKTEIYREQAYQKEKIKTADDMYNNVISAYGASEAWEAAIELNESFPNDSRIQKAFNESAERLLTLGTNNHRQSNFSTASIYYEMILSEKLVSNELSSQAKAYNAQAKNRKPLKTANNMYDEVINAYGATEAWDAAKAFRANFPEDKRIGEAFNAVATRLLTLGTSNHKNRSYSSAIIYYEMILSEEIIDTNIRRQASVYNAQATGKKSLRTSDNMFTNALGTYGASNAWNAAIEFKESFPNDPRVHEAIDTTAERLLTLGSNHHKKKNYSTAIVYYDMILKEKLVSLNLYEKTEVYKKQATNQKAFRTSDDMYSEAMSAYGATSAWSFAIEFKSSFPNDSRVTFVVNTAANRLLTLGINNHKLANFKTASTYYDMILSEESIDSSLELKANSYNYLAQNNLKLTNTIAKYDNYNRSLEQILDIQMKRAPQVSHNGGWINAKRNEVEEYINPKNIIPNDISTALTTLKIITSSLRVRTGPSTNHTHVNTVYNGEVYTILDEDNGWYKIGLKNGTNGWISGSTSYVARNTSVLQFLVLSGTSGISTRDLDEELENAGILKGHGDTFRAASRKGNVNEFYLIAHAMLETGNGSSRLANGIRVTEVDGEPVEPKIVYNMYGIGAVDRDPNRLGAERAYKEGWFTPSEAIIGGAKWISDSYINNKTYKQDTLYKMRWNPEHPGTHQYATDIAWAYKQTRTLNSIVLSAQKYDLILNFDIPIYQ